MCNCNSCRVEDFLTKNNPTTFTTYLGETVRIRDGRTGMVMRVYCSKYPHTVEVDFEDGSPNEMFCILDVEEV